MRAKIPLAALIALAASTTVSYAQPQPPVPPEPEFKIEPTFENLNEMTFAGIAAYAGPGSPRFPELWTDGFQDVLGDTRNGEGAQLGLETEKYAYGLELFPPAFDQKHKFTYLACFSVIDSRKVPLHLLQRTIPAAKYAVFKVPGGLTGLGKTFQYIYSRWLPASGFDRPFNFDMERYDISPGAEKDGQLSIEVLVPITSKKGVPK